MNSCLIRYWSLNSPTPRMTVKPMRESPKVWNRMIGSWSGTAPSTSVIVSAMTSLVTRSTCSRSLS